MDSNKPFESLSGSTTLGIDPNRFDAVWGPLQMYVRGDFTGADKNPRYTPQQFQQMVTTLRNSPNRQVFVQPNVRWAQDDAVLDRMIQSYADEYYSKNPKGNGKSYNIDGTVKAPPPKAAPVVAPSAAPMNNIKRGASGPLARGGLMQKQLATPAPAVAQPVVQPVPEQLVAPNLSEEEFANAVRAWTEIGGGYGMASNDPSNNYTKSFRNRFNTAAFAGVDPRFMAEYEGDYSRELGKRRVTGDSYTKALQEMNDPEIRATLLKRYGTDAVRSAQDAWKSWGLNDEVGLGQYRSYLNQDRFAGGVPVQFSQYRDYQNKVQDYRKQNPGGTNAFSSDYEKKAGQYALDQMGAGTMQQLIARPMAGGLGVGKRQGR